MWYLFGASLRLTPMGLTRKISPGDFLFGASLRLTPMGLTRKISPGDFLFGGSLHLTPVGLPRINAPGVFLILLLLGLLSMPVHSQPVTVFVSVQPQKTFVERVGGEHVQVFSMVQPGHSPATYEPTPRQVARLARADLYIRIGVPFENAWMGRISAVNPHMRVLDARQGIDLRQLESHGQDEHPGHVHEIDPHIWTSPPLVRRMADDIRRVLGEMLPQRRTEFDANYEEFAAELDALDLEIRQLFADLSQRRFLIFHPAWGYFADTYGLEQIAVEKGGKEPGAKSLSILIGQARREQVKVIFIQPQFDRKLAEQFARNIDARVEVLDPLAADYIPNLRRAARLIAGAAR